VNTLCEELDAIEAAAYCNLTLSTLRQYRSSGRGPGFRGQGTEVRYRRADLDAYLVQAGKKPAVTPAVIELAREIQALASTLRHPTELRRFSARLSGSSNVHPIADEFGFLPTQAGATHARE